MTPLRREIGQKSTLEERIHLGFAGQRSTAIGLIDETPGHYIYRISAVASRRQIRAPNLLPKSIFDQNRDSNMRAQLARDPIRASRCPIHDDPILHGPPPLRSSISTRPSRPNTAASERLRPRQGVCGRRLMGGRYARHPMWRVVVCQTAIVH